MNETVKKYIYKYYEKGADKEYLNSCSQEFLLPSEIINFCSLNKIVVKPGKHKIWPEKYVRFIFQDFIKGNFEVKYCTVLRISKVAPIYNLTHEFVVENIDPNRISPILDGYSAQAYIKLQSLLEDVIQNELLKLDYEELLEIDEVILNLKINNNKELIGKQITVEAALFYDLLELCPD
ncbi:hypothetical protein [Bacillus sp. EAC]|uniref:hypothetical protein n=1 Tax=Bacillus sp. EAC TaxID=1978338 RepID=UPI000B4418D8|nr:hypothetical protein [Bacillus sp. EAC]